MSATPQPHSVTHDESASRFVIDLGSMGEAELAYARVGADVLDLQHTLVPPEARGEGVADALVQAAVAHARQTGARLIATCRYVAAWKGRHAQAADVFVEG
jgi:hypothetical protein